MTPEPSPRSGLHPSIVLSAYVEPLVRGRRVAVLGDASIGLADELSQRGARLVHVYDPDTARTAEALARAAPGRPHQVAYAVLAGDLGVRDGAFDVVVVPDLALFSDPAEIMRRVRRLCAASGVAVFVTPNGGAAGRRLLPEHRPVQPAPAGLGYYELFDLISLQFAKVRMIGQAPFVGYTVADFTLRGEPEVSVDTSLLGHSEEPEYFIALASDRPVSLDAYAVIELPWHEVADAYSPSAGAVAARAAETAALAAAEARAGELAVEVEKARAHAAAQAKELEAKAQAGAALAARVAELETSASARSSRVIELETEVSGREVRLKEIEARAGDSHVRAERLTNQIRDLDEELRRQRDRGTKLSKLLDDEKKARTKAEVELGMLRGRPEAPGAKERAEALAIELAAAQQRISDLELELTQTPRRPSPVPVAPDPLLLRRIEELTGALAAARREAEGAVAVAKREAAEALGAAQREAAQAVARAQREAAEASAQRDGSIERARRAEAALAGRAPGEEQVADLVRDNDELAARVAASTDQVAELEKRLLAEREREMAAGRIAAEGARRLAEAEKQAAEAEKRASDLARSLSTVEKRASELDTRLAAQDARLAEVSAALATEKRKAAERTDDRGAVDAAAADLASLESALRERGRVITALQRDLRESERVGRELLGELTSLGGNGTASPAAEELRARLDTLAQSAARGEADLQAASWKIAQLERELTDARSGAPAAPAQVELEQALAAARDEVAALRRALESRPG
jgi:SAM-dependent methyltransferase